jgi:hypothetical protein
MLQKDTRSAQAALGIGPNTKIFENQQKQHLAISR